MNKTIIEVAVYLNAAYGKVSLNYVPTCEKGIRLMAWYNSKQKDSKGEQRKSNHWTESQMTDLMAQMASIGKGFEAQVVKTPKMPTLPRVGDVIAVDGAIDAPDFL